MPSAPATPTPTKATFGQRPLPSSPFPQAVQIPESIEENKELHHTDGSQHSRKSRDGSEDADMDGSVGDGHGDEGASDDESVNADGTRSGKKKKSQRFYCTDYPPCNLSFTRSEHLARHIRYAIKHPHSPHAAYLTGADRTQSGNTLVSDHSSAIARDDSRGSTTCDSMHKPFTSMKISQSIRSRRLARDSSARSAQIESASPGGLGPQQQAASAPLPAVTPSPSLHPALAL